jgi:hypothetical protein
MRPRRHLHPILLAAFISLSLAWVGLSGTGYAGEAATAEDVPSDVEGGMLCRSVNPEALLRQHLSACHPQAGLLMVNTEPPLPDISRDASNPDSHLPSSRSSLMESQGSGVVRRKSGGSRLKYDAGVMRSMGEGKLLGLGFSRQLAPSISFSGQTGLGFTEASPQWVVAFGIKIKF